MRPALAWKLTPAMSGSGSRESSLGVAPCAASIREQSSFGVDKFNVVMLLMKT